ncbi:DUF6502 family protein [Pseudomonadota bacterium]
MPNSKSSNNSAAPPEPIVAAITKVLRPLVGLLLEYGMTYPWLSSLLKSVYVDVAEREFKLTGKDQTDSRVSLLTGVHRKDVRRLRQAEPVDTSPPASVLLGAQLVALWTSDDQFAYKNGKPRPLWRLSSANKGPSFELLVSSVSKDIRPRSVLDEWLRLGVVEIDAKDRVCLKADAFVPSEGFEEKSYYLGQNLHDHLAAARHNVQGNKPAHMERSVYYDRLSPESVKTLRRESETEGMRVLKTINVLARKLQRGDQKSADNHHRTNLGVYFYDVDEQQEQDITKPEE